VGLVGGRRPCEGGCAVDVSLHDGKRAKESKRAGSALQVALGEASKLYAMGAEKRCVCVYRCRIEGPGRLERNARSVPLRFDLQLN
jgi:hypothetical protein